MVLDLSVSDSQFTTSVLFPMDIYSHLYLWTFHCACSCDLSSLLDISCLIDCSYLWFSLFLDPRALVLPHWKDNSAEPHWPLYLWWINNTSVSWRPTIVPSTFLILTTNVLLLYFFFGFAGFVVVILFVCFLCPLDQETGTS